MGFEDAPLCLVASPEVPMEQDLQAVVERGGISTQGCPGRKTG